jgi:4-hydroxy-tetrahydrodipicolinate reductase
MKIKGIVYGIGTIGKLTTKYMSDKGIEIVGAIDTNPEIVGKDLGEVAGLDRDLGIRISADSDSVLSEQDTDIVAVSVFSQMERMFPIFKTCIENGINVITSSEEALYPWIGSSELAAQLDALAKEHGVTISASGLQDIFRVNLISLLTGASHSIESVSGMQQYDLYQSGPASIGNYCIGDTVDECHRKMEEKGAQLNSFRISLEAILADLGLTITRITEKEEVLTDDVDVEARGVIGGIIKRGLVTGMKQIMDIETKQGIPFHGEKISKVFNSNEKVEGNTHEWFIKGVPEMHLKIRLDEIEAKSATVAQLVNRIPDVINCEPGYITMEKLGKLKYRTLPLHHYVEPHSFVDSG